MKLSKLMKGFNASFIAVSSDIGRRQQNALLCVQSRIMSSGISDRDRSATRQHPSHLLAGVFGLRRPWRRLCAGMDAGSTEPHLRTQASSRRRVQDLARACVEQGKPDRGERGHHLYCPAGAARGRECHYRQLPFIERIGLPELVRLGSRLITGAVLNLLPRAEPVKPCANGRRQFGCPRLVRGGAASPANTTPQAI
ncbi:hypothetical protein GGE07_005892 [Sinorhizobium terangae]|nr:hypothetical protein [Sinorhizobium terangae]